MYGYRHLFPQTQSQPFGDHGVGHCVLGSYSNLFLLEHDNILNFIFNMFYNVWFYNISFILLFHVYIAYKFLGIEEMCTGKIALMSLWATMPSCADTECKDPLMCAEINHTFHSFVALFHQSK